MTWLWCFSSFNWHCAALLSFMAFATPTASLINGLKIPNSSRIGKIPLRFVTGNIRQLFLLRFHVHINFRFGFYSRPNSSSLSKSRIFRSNPFPRLFNEYFVSYMSFHEIFAPQISYIVFATRRVQWTINGRLIPRSPLANRFSKCVPGSQNRYTRICNSIGSAFIAWFKKPQFFMLLLLLLTFATIFYKLHWTINMRSMTGQIIMFQAPTLLLNL